LEGLAGYRSAAFPADPYLNSEKYTSSGSGKITGMPEESNDENNTCHGRESVGFSAFARGEMTMPALILRRSLSEQRKIYFFRQRENSANAGWFE